MDLVDVIHRHGGLATRAQLVAATSPATLDRAVGDGVVRRVGRGRYTLPGVDDAAATAHGMHGTLCLAHAALHHGWPVLRVPDRPQVLVPRKRNVPRRFRTGVDLHRRDLRPDERDGIATSSDVTLEQCLRLLPDDEALAVADSALRAGEHVLVQAVADRVRGPGADRVRRAAAAASADAANPFESALRAICLSVPRLAVIPQLVISSPWVWARPDLADEGLRLVVEAESFEWHGSRSALRKDVRRYSLLVADGWVVLRFIWEDVMFRPDWVRRVVAHTAARLDTRTQLVDAGTAPRDPATLDDLCPRVRLPQARSSPG